MKFDSASKMLRWAYLPECANPAEGWEVKPFIDIADVIAGQSPPSETYNEKSDGLPFLQGNGDFSDKHPNPKIWCSLPAKCATTGDILISVRAPVGELNRADRDYCIGRGLAAVRASGCDPDFLYHALQRWRWCLQRVAQGTTFDAITARHFSQLRVAIPIDKSEQAAIARILDAVDTAHEGTSATIERAQAVKKALLQRFFYDALGETAYADHPRRGLPAGWSLVATGELLSNRPKNGVSPEASSQPPGTPTFSIGAIRKGRIDLSTNDNIKYTRLPEVVARKFAIERGDILIVRGNANPEFVGQAGMVTTHPVGCIYPDITMRVVFRTDIAPKVHPDFGVLAWNHPVVHNQVLRRAKTSNGTLKINSRDVMQIVMPVPPENEQVQLVKIVSAIEARIDALNEVALAQYRLKRALMHDLLAGRVRVTRPMKAIA
jgi:type I restriction enzyme S subunit